MKCEACGTTLNKGYYTCPACGKNHPVPPDLSDMIIETLESIIYGIKEMFYFFAENKLALKILLATSSIAAIAVLLGMFVL